MLSNAYFLKKFRFDTAENEPSKNLQILPILLTLPLTNVGSGGPGADVLGVPAPAVRGPVERGAARGVPHVDAGLRAEQPHDDHGVPKLKGSIGEGSNQSNFSNQSSVKIVNNEHSTHF